jgi:hypothetical protein
MQKSINKLMESFNHEINFKDYSPNCQTKKTFYQIEYSVLINVNIFPVIGSKRFSLFETDSILIYLNEIIFCVKQTIFQSIFFFQNTFSSKLFADKSK